MAAVSFVAASGLQAFTASPVTTTIPTGSATSDLMLLWYAGKPTSAVPYAAISGYTSASSSSNGTSSSATLDADPVRMQMYWKLHTGTESAPSVTAPATPDPVVSAMTTYRSSTGSFTPTYNGYYGTDTRANLSITPRGISDTDNTGTTWSANVNNVAISVGDIVVFGIVVRSDSAAYTGWTMSATGLTFGTVSQRLATTTTISGQDLSFYVVDAQVATGESEDISITLSGTCASGYSSFAAQAFVLRAQVHAVSSIAVCDPPALTSVGTSNLDFDLITSLVKTGSTYAILARLPNTNYANVYTSTDLLTWTSRYTTTGGDCNWLTEINGNLVLGVSSSPYAKYSTDLGVNWNNSTGLTAQPNGMKADNGVLIGSGFGVIVRSTDDGASWSTVASGLGDWSVGHSHNGSGTWVGGSGNQLHYSTNNGANWTNGGAVRNFSGSYGHTQWSGDRFFVVGTSSSTKLTDVAYSSSDGLTWYAVGEPFGHHEEFKNFEFYGGLKDAKITDFTSSGICFIGGNTSSFQWNKWQTWSNYIYWSRDGIRWESFSNLDSYPDLKHIYLDGDTLYLFRTAKDETSTVVHSVSGTDAYFSDAVPEVTTSEYHVPVNLDATTALTVSPITSVTGSVPAKEKSATASLVVYPFSNVVGETIFYNWWMIGAPSIGTGTNGNGQATTTVTTNYADYGSGSNIAMVEIVSNGSSTSQTTSVTFGGVSLDLVAFQADTTELGTTEIWFVYYAAGWAGSAEFVITRSGTDTYRYAIGATQASRELSVLGVYENTLAATNDIPFSMNITSPDTRVAPLLAMFSGEAATSSVTFNWPTYGTWGATIDFGQSTGYLYTDSFIAWTPPGTLTPYYKASDVNAVTSLATQSNDDVAVAVAIIGYKPPATYGEENLVVRPIVEATGEVIPNVGPQTHTATAALTPSISVSATAGAIARSSTAAVTVAPTVSASGLVTDTATAAITLAQTVSASGRVTDTATAAITLAASMSASGVVTDTATAALTLAPTTSASGLVTDTATAAITLAPTPTAEGTTQFIWESDTALTMGYTVSANSRVTKTVTAAVTTATTEAATGLVTDTATAALTAGLAVSATGLVTDTATAALTASITQSASGLVLDTATASITAGITVAASGFTSGSGSVALTSTPTVSASGIVTDSATAAITTAPTVSATGLVTDTATAAITLAPSTSATGLVNDYGVAALTVSPTVTATGVTTKSVTAAVTVDPVETATAGAIARTATAAVLVDPDTTASGMAYVSRFLRPDALLSMSGLTGTYLDIQDSPTSPDGNALTPTGGPIDVRMSFENDSGNMRLGTNDQVIRVLLTVP